MKNMTVERHIDYMERIIESTEAWVVKMSKHVEDMRFMNGHGEWRFHLYNEDTKE